MSLIPFKWKKKRPGGTGPPPSGGGDSVSFRPAAPPQITAQCAGHPVGLEDFPFIMRPACGNDGTLSSPAHEAELGLYEALRCSVPVIDAAIQKIVRLTGGFRLASPDGRIQEELDRFVRTVPVGLSGQTLMAFLDGYLDSLLTYGSAVGEILPDPLTGELAGLCLGSVRDLAVMAGDSPISPLYFRRGTGGRLVPLPHPERIVFTALNPPPGCAYGISILRGLPAVSKILLGIYRTIGQNFDRVGNLRYSISYKPQDASDRAFAGERAAQIAREWSDGMRAAQAGQVRDFVTVGDVEIKAIGADSQVLSTEVPVRQLLEQIIAKLSIPPFLLGFSWSSTERMSAQQADILTSELEFYRRMMTPVLRRIGEAFLRMKGCLAPVSVEWETINLQDEVEHADARLKTAQARRLELELDAAGAPADHLLE